MRDHDFEEKFYAYLETLGNEDARNAVLPALDIINNLPEDETDDDDY